jgi:predicted RNase H-like HicB family nuclease
MVYGLRSGAMVAIGIGARVYTVVLIPDEQMGGYSVEVPALPGCLTQGDTLKAALANAHEAIECHIAGLEQDGEPVPVETQHPLTSLVAV